ncbi:MAG TPA: NAD(P)H-quinone oxidoreductase [Thermoanaerobaculia bacterium]|nr:NAD(P)H-quinone oxidoreductase [Thermoanaerobaculia bacterium]
MKAILFDAPGDESVLRLGETEDPVPGPGEALIAIRATAVNRADLLQREGAYPPPPGASSILGLECAGLVEAVGEKVWEVKPGDRVMALLAGGGYAEKAVVDGGSLIPVPEHFSDDEAAAFPEGFLTAYLNLFLLGGAGPGSVALIHGGGSGVGTSAIQLCRESGVMAIVTVGSSEKGARCESLGASLAVNYREQRFEDVIREWTGGRGVDVILDHIGGEYLTRNLGTLAPGGRLIVIGGMGGRKGELDLGLLLTRGLKILGSALRPRSVEEKQGIIRAFGGEFGDALRAGRLRPVVDSVYPLAEAAEAHRRMKESRHFGKIVLRVTG